MEWWPNPFTEAWSLEMLVCVSQDSQWLIDALGKRFGLIEILFSHRKGWKPSLERITFWWSACSLTLTGQTTLGELIWIILNLFEYCIIKLKAVQARPFKNLSDCLKKKWIIFLRLNFYQMRQFWLFWRSLHCRWISLWQRFLTILGNSWLDAGLGVPLLGGHDVDPAVAVPLHPHQPQRPAAFGGRSRRDEARRGLGRRQDGQAVLWVLQVWRNQNQQHLIAPQ